MVLCVLIIVSFPHFSPPFLLLPLLWMRLLSWVTSRLHQLGSYGFISIPVQPTLAQLRKDGMSLTGTLRVKALTRRLRSSVRRTTSLWSLTVPSAYEKENGQSYVRRLVSLMKYVFKRVSGPYFSEEAWNLLLCLCSSGDSRTKSHHHCYPEKKNIQQIKICVINRPVNTTNFAGR